MSGPDASSTALAVVKNGVGTVANVGGSALWAAGSYLAKVATSSPQVPSGSGDAITDASPDPSASTLGGLNSVEALRIANTLEGLFGNAQLQGSSLRCTPEVPRLVVVGTQSSGKSSLLNGIMGADLLPQAEHMCTRAPLNLQLIRHLPEGEMHAEFGVTTNGTWQVQQSVPLTCPDPSAAELAQIRDAIEAQTAARAGHQKGVSHEPIFMRIYSPHVPNLSLVDLPGLTMTALTDQGQPRDIKMQVRQMITKYIEQERTIILMVCPARMDLEADPALELVKEFDPTGSRTIGVLTKVDLMNDGTDVRKYLLGEVPADLQLQLGYFAIRNRTPAETGKHGGTAISVREGFATEDAYFSKHPVYGAQRALLQERLTTPTLTRFLSKVLLEHLKRHMPSIVSEVAQLLEATERRLGSMGQAVPSDEGSRVGMVQALVAGFCRDYVGSLTEKRADVKTGRRIKDAFSKLQLQLRELTPFDAETFPDAEILEAVRDCEGNHLSFPVPPIELIEQMMQHPEKRPLQTLLPPCLNCLATVRDELQLLTSHLLQQPALTRFPRLRTRVREEVDALLSRAHADAQNKLLEMVAMEEAYIYTNDDAFLSELASAVKKLLSHLNASLLRQILVSYFSTVQRAISHNAPKAVMLFMVKASQQAVYAHLFDAIGSQSTEGLLDEPPEVEAKRRSDAEALARLRAAKLALQSLA